MGFCALPTLAGRCPGLPYSRLRVGWSLQTSTLYFHPHTYSFPEPYKIQKLLRVS